MFERKADFGARHGEAADDIEAGGIFGARAAQELAACGHLGEKLLDPDACAGRECGRPLPLQFAIVDDAAPPVGAARRY